MKRLLLLLCLFALPARARAFSTVFNGDPVNPSTNTPYEVMPGFPLVEPGVDGILGTIDDVVTPSIVGDIDMVVRSGSPAATTIIQAPQIQSGRNTVPVGVAGSTASAGTAVPFAVFLSDGIVDASAPSGRLLTTSDMDNIPVIVAAFADYDGDGFIGPTDLDASTTTDNHFEIRELEPVGRAVALFSGGVARGSLNVQAGLPPSTGGLSIVLTAQALTGPFDAGFNNGEVPSGPAISTVLPFVPQRDLARLFRDRAVLVSPNTTLQQVIRYAALPSSAAPAPFALPLDGTSLTIDVAVVNSQPAVKAALFEDIEPLGMRRRVSDAVVGNRSPATKAVFRLMPTDRWGNPADPPANFSVGLIGTLPAVVQKPRAPVVLAAADGIEARFKVKRQLADGVTGAVTIEVAGAVVDAVRYVVDARRNRVRVDALVPSQLTPTIQSAIDSVYDKRRDGRLVISIAPGIYHENIAVNRTVVLRGDGAGTTFIQGNGSADVMSFSVPGASALGLTAIGGSTGILVGASGVDLADLAALRNIGAGISLVGADASLTRIDAVDNGGNGLSISGANAACADAGIVDNFGAGAVLTTPAGVAISDSLVLGNNLGGVLLTNGGSSTVAGNRIANNFGIGIGLNQSNSNQVASNLVVLSDDDGLNADRTGGNFISANVFDNNNGYGMFLRRSDGDDDFAAVSGVQTAPGDNTVTNNRKGSVFIRTN